MSIQDENNVVLNENSVQRKPCIDRESKSNELTIKLYSSYDNNIKLLLVVTTPSIYHGCSTWKMFSEEKFSGKENLFLTVDLKILVVTMLGKTRISGVVKSTSTCKSYQSLKVWTRCDFHLVQTVKL